MDTEGLSRAATQMIDAGALVVFLPLLVVAALLSGPVARRLHTSRLLAALSLTSLAGIFAVTRRESDMLLLLSDIDAVATCSDCIRFSWITDAALWSGVSHVDMEWLLNVMLFIPAGLFMTLALRRPDRVLAILIGLSASIEIIQDLTFLGQPDPSDLVANSLGAVAGVAIGMATLVLSPRLGTHDGVKAPSRQGLALGLGAIFLLVGLGWVGQQLGADQRRDVLRGELQDRFVGSTSADIESRLATEDGFSELISRLTTRPAYLARVGETDQFEGRYSVHFFGSYRCVYIRWTTTGFTLRDGSGDECNVFRDRPASE